MHESRCLDRRAVKRVACDLSITTRCRRSGGQELARRRGQRIPRPDRRRGGQDYRRLVERLPVIVYAAELGEHGALALRQPPGRGDPRLHRRGVHRRPRASGRGCCTPTTASGRWRSKPRSCSAAATRAGRVPDVHPRRRDRLDARRGGARSRRGRASRSGTASSTTSPSASGPRPSCSAPLAQQAVVAKLGERALQDGDPEALMRAATELIGERRRRPQRLHLGGRPRRPPPEPAGRPRGGRGRRRPPRLRRPRLARRRRPRLRHATRSSPTGGSEERFTMPPVLRVFGAASQPGGDDRRQGPPLRRPRRPLDRAGPLQRQGRPLRPGRRQRPRRRDRAPRRRPGAAPPRPPRLAHRPAEPAQLRRRARRGAARARPSPARRSGSSSSTSTTSS